MPPGKGAHAKGSVLLQADARLEETRAQMWLTSRDRWWRRRARELGWPQGSERTLPVLSRAL